MTGESVTPEQPPSGPLSARESASTPAVGPSRGTGGPSGPQTGAESLDRTEVHYWDADKCAKAARLLAEHPPRNVEILASTALRDQYAAAIASYDHAVGQATDPAPGDHHHGQAAAVHAVRDRELEQARAAITEVRRLCELTIAASVRVQAVEQARDTLAALDRHTTA